MVNVADILLGAQSRLIFFSTVLENRAMPPSLPLFLEITPNPRTRRIGVGGELTPQPLDFGFAPENNDFLGVIFSIEGVAGVHIGSDFISITLVNEETWPMVANEVLRIVTEGLPKLDLTPFLQPQDSAPAADDPITAKIKDVLATRVRPAVAHDGGDITFHSFVDGVLALSMRGACSGCPSATATLKMGIANLMRFLVPEVKEIVAA